MTPDEYETKLADLLRMIQGKTWPFSQGLCTYPRSTDAGQQALHAACLDLERRGQIVRQAERLMESWVAWMPCADITMRRLPKE